MLALVLAAAFAGGRVASKLGYPSILGEIAAGIILGPPLLGILAGNETIDVLGEFGILLMMLYIGVYLDLGDLRRASVPGLLAAIGGFLVPTALGIALMLAVGSSGLEALFVGLAMGVTSLATKTRILVDLKILDTRIAHVLVAGAVLSDVAVLVVFAAVIGQGPTNDISLGTASLAGIKAIAFAFGVWIVGGVLLPKAKTWLGNRDIDRTTALISVVVFGLTFSWAAEVAGLHAILGAFVAGLFIDKQVLTTKISKDVQQKLAWVSVGLLAPFFFVSAGFEVSFGVFRTDLWLLVAVIVLATVGKLVGTAVFYLLSGNGWREGIVVGAGMNGRGAVEIIVAEIALTQGLIDRDIFSILVFMALFTTAMDPILLTQGVRWLRRRGELVRAGDRTEILMVGAGTIARVLATTLQETRPVTVIDTNRTNLAEAAKFGLGTHPGNGLDEVTLEMAGIDRAMQLIAATPNAEMNVLIAQLAFDLGVPEVCVVLNEADSATFAGRLAADGISVMPAPDDWSRWASQVRSGDAVVVDVEIRTAEGSKDLASLNGAPLGQASPLFPLVVVSNGDRSPFTIDTDLADVERVMCLKRADEASVGVARWDPSVTSEW